MKKKCTVIINFSISMEYLIMKKYQKYCKTKRNKIK